MQDRDFMAQNQDFDVLSHGAAGEQPEPPAEYPEGDQIQQPEQHSR